MVARGHHWEVESRMDCGLHSPSEDQKSPVWGFTPITGCAQVGFSFVSSDLSDFCTTRRITTSSVNRFPILKFSLAGLDESYTCESFIAT